MTRTGGTAGGRDDRTPLPRLLVLPLEDRVVFPGEVTTIEARDGPAGAALEALSPSDACVVVPARRDDPEGAAEGRNGGPARLYAVGTRVRVVTRHPRAAGGFKALVQGRERVRVGTLEEEGSLLWCMPVITPDRGWEPKAGHSSSHRRMLANLQAVAEADPKYPGELADLVPAYGDDPGRITDLAASLLPLAHTDRALLLAETDPEERVLLLNRILESELVRARAGDEIDDQLARRVRREYLLQKLEVLRNELGEPLPHVREANRYEERVRDTPVSPAAMRALLRELDQLRRIPPNSQEAARIRNYVDWVLELPWSASPPLRTDDDEFGRVTSALAESHIGLEDVKERIVEFLAVRRLGGGSRGTVVCFLGPPGTGKSSMGRAVAEALGRNHVTIPVGAMTHEREIVGISHKQESGTPGAILEGVHRVGTRNPVVLLDEIDKLSLGGEGTSAGALMQLLDPEQNSEFLDHYLGVPFDLSGCLFLATANDLDDIPDALLDRMEIIEFNGYTESEKYRIARDHLLPRARLHSGLDAGSLRLSPAALRAVIRGYTEEAGVRQLHRILVAIARKAAVRVVRGEAGLQVNRKDLRELLGPPTVDEDLRLRRPAIGVATGLAWTSVGGSLLPIEALGMPGSGRLILTGSVGEVLRESVQTALSFVRTCLGPLGLQQSLLDSIDLHLHLPSTATPKDGPSAGLPITLAIVSLLTLRPARHDFGSTGEVSLLGSILPVGGMREKLLAALRAGLREVIVPSRNAEEILRLPAEIRRSLKIHPVDDALSALDLALLPRKTKRAEDATKGGSRSTGRRRARRRRSGGA